MSTQPLVSIIMGAYNCAETLGACIDSIINQTYENWEFIICDDCSTDQTPDILADYARKDSRIIIICNEVNSRLAASLNNCLSVARGEYIARMDADDVCVPHRLGTQVEFLETHKKFACVGSDRIIFDEQGDRGIRKSTEDPDIIILRHGAPFAHPTIMMKKTVFDELGGYVSSKETMRAEDLDLWFRFYYKGYKGYNIQEPLYRYRESETDFKKRGLKAALGTAFVFLKGYHLLKFPLYVYPQALKPIVSALIPNKVMKKYHYNKDNK